MVAFKLMPQYGFERSTALDMVFRDYVNRIRLDILGKPWKRPKNA